MQTASILLIEDHLITQDLTRLFLERHKFIVTCTENGELALILSQQHQFKIIIIDIGLPDYSGFELITFLKQQNPEAAYIGVTTQFDETMLEKAKQVGFVDLLEKPLTELSRVDGKLLIDYLSSMII